jgi:toxin ParE1/3/4
VILPIFSPLAKEDLLAIGRFIAQDNLQAALATLEKIEERCADAVEHPRIGRDRSDLLEGMRSLTEGDYVIFYRAKGKTVEIVRILHGKQDLPEIFENEG